MVYLAILQIINKSLCSFQSYRLSVAGVSFVEGEVKMDQIFTILLMIIIMNIILANFSQSIINPMRYIGIYILFEISLLAGKRFFN